MKTVSPSDVREPLYTFRCPKLGYDIVMIPHSEQDRVRLKREAKRKGMSLVEFARENSSTCWSAVAKSNDHSDT